MQYARPDITPCIPPKKIVCTTQRSLAGWDSSRLVHVECEVHKSRGGLGRVAATQSSNEPGGLGYVGGRVAFGLGGDFPVGELRSDQGEKVVRRRRNKQKDGKIEGPKLDVKDEKVGIRSRLPTRGLTKPVCRTMDWVVTPAAWRENYCADESRTGRRKRRHPNGE